MKNLSKRIKLLSFLLLMVYSVKAQQDSIRFSLLTCAPGQEVYSLYGHTAIRYQNFSDNTDLVFNYGMFNFNAPHFIYRFVKGETDYQLGITPYSYFESGYALRGSSVYEQELNLTPAEKEKLFRLLAENYKKENRVYRYNYFYDNCTTRARDQIERSIQGEVVYPHFPTSQSFRSIIHEFSVHSPWNILGIDFCLGMEADEPIDDRQRMFAPFYMKDYAEGAYIQNPDGTKRPLIRGGAKIVDVEPEPNQAFPLHPMTVSVLFLLLNLVIAYVQVKKHRIYWGWDAFLYTVQGLAGCIVAFLFFFSVHPTVGSNLNILLFNPIPLLLLPYIIYTDVKHRKNIYFGIKVVYLTLFIVFIFFSPQKFNLSVLPLALSLLANSASHLLVYYKK